MSITKSSLSENVNCVMEIVINGLTKEDIDKGIRESLIAISKSKYKICKRPRDQKMRRTLSSSVHQKNCASPPSPVVVPCNRGSTDSLRKKPKNFRWTGSGVGFQIRD